MPRTMSAQRSRRPGRGAPAGTGEGAPACPTPRGGRGGARARGRTALHDRQRALGGRWRRAALDARAPPRGAGAAPGRSPTSAPYVLAVAGRTHFSPARLAFSTPDRLAVCHPERTERVDTARLRRLERCFAGREPERRALFEFRALCRSRALVADTVGIDRALLRIAGRWGRDANALHALLLPATDIELAVLAPRTGTEPWGSESGRWRCWSSACSPPTGPCPRSARRSAGSRASSPRRSTPRPREARCSRSRRPRPGPARAPRCSRP